MLLSIIQVNLGPKRSISIDKKKVRGKAKGHCWREHSVDCRLQEVKCASCVHLNILNPPLTQTAGYVKSLIGLSH